MLALPSLVSLILLAAQARQLQPSCNSRHRMMIGLIRMNHFIRITSANAVATAGFTVSSNSNSPSS